MYKVRKHTPTSITVNNSYKGETLEAKIRRIVNNNEPISDGAPLIYTDRKDGVQAAYDIRTDRFEIAVEAMDHITKTNLAKRADRMKIGEQAKDGMAKEGESGAQSAPKA